MRQSKSEPTENEVAQVDDKRSSDLLGLPVRSVISLVDFVGKWSSVLTLFYVPKSYRAEEQTESSRRRQARRVDRVVISWWIIPFLCWLIISWRLQYLDVLALAVVVLRITNIVSYHLRNAFVGGLTVRGPSPVVHFFSFRRSLVLGFLNYFELIVCFACIYTWQLSRLIWNSGPDWFSPFFFSMATQLTIAYGDVIPGGWLRPVACFQAACGILIIVVVISRLISQITVDEMDSSDRDLSGLPRPGACDPTAEQ